jgi:anaerobic nitric oxide reductase transcription regulator
LLSLALDLSASLTSEDRYRRVLDVLRALVPCDAACLLARDGDRLVPLAAHGLTPDALGRIYTLDQPRFAAIAAAPGLIRFPPDSPLPDPFDGLLAAEPSGRVTIHACLGHPLRIDGALVGLIAADAIAENAFDRVAPGALSWLAALAAAALRTGRLIEALEGEASKQRLLAADLLRSTALTRGGEIIGRSSVIQRLKGEIEIVAPSDLPVLISGETGTGKELVARAIHAASKRRDAPILYLNCAALPESIAEAEIFGHTRGAFTGAEAARPGKFEVADGGTLFLDEVGELSPVVQPKLLRAIQEGEVQRVGADRPLHVDVRVIAATNRDLDREVAAGRFRADLFHRLAGYPLRVPPLRERSGDVVILAGYFCDRARLQLGLGRVSLDAAARSALEAYSWPGNVRELENVIFRAALRAAAQTPRGEAVILDREAFGPELDPLPDLSAELAGPADPAAPHASLREQVDDFQRRLISQALDACSGSWAAAARRLGMHRSNLHHLAKRLGLS